MLVRQAKISERPKLFPSYRKAHTPAEALAELEVVITQLGLKTLMFASLLHRPVEAAQKGRSLKSQRRSTCMRYTQKKR
jgi:hypothetical protein